MKSFPANPATTSILEGLKAKSSVDCIVDGKVATELISNDAELFAGETELFVGYAGSCW